jgi:predicted TIM-barrel fold metal-dependent hydrolase
MGITDAQIHVWAGDTAERPWPHEHSEPHRGLPLSAREVIAELDRAGVDRAVLVPPSWEGDRNDVALAAVDAHPGRFAVMGRVNLLREEPDEVAAWADQPGMLGVRLTFLRPDQRGWLANGTADWVFAVAAEAGLPVMLLAPGQSDQIAAVADRYGDLRLIVDHCNLSTDITTAEIGPTIDALSPLADRPNVAVKISALPCYVVEPFPFPSLHPHIRRVIDAFGADRCMWGSDLSRLPCPYDEWVRVFTEATGVVSDDERDAVLGSTAATWLNWPE